MRYPYNWPHGSWAIKKAPNPDYVSNYQVTGPPQQIFVRLNGLWSAFDRDGNQIMPNYYRLEQLLVDLVETFQPTGAAP